MCIIYVVVFGDVCFFVGYNVVFRWLVIQDVIVYIDEDGYEKYWFEVYVLEDFEMVFCFQVVGYMFCYVFYIGDGFKEGVSLIVYDELVCWEKYVFGCNEFLFYFF